jgi:oligopeptide/dipeptide ABC transporter ATP-binding protein
VSPPILEVRDLVVRYPLRRGLGGRPRAWVQAVNGVSFSIAPGETLGLVGESGSGKSTVARCCLDLERPTGGAVLVEGRDLTALRGRERRRLRRRTQIVFQDPQGSLNPRLDVETIIGEGLAAQGERSASRRRERVAEVLRQVGLPQDAARRYPNAFSGGQRQRIGIARALAPRPALIVLDEAVAALDVSVRAQVVNLLLDLQDSMGLSYLFIAHDLSMVEVLSHRVAVLYTGRIVEIGGRDPIFGAPGHPYTRALLAAVPVADPEAAAPAAAVTGEPPSPLAPPAGCAFHARCPHVEARCREEVPVLRELDPGHEVACHLAPLDAPAADRGH